MELTDALKALFVDTAQALKGSARRIFMARTVKERGLGGQRRAERELGWHRGTLRKGMQEFASGFTCLDAFAARGRKRAEDHLPHLLVDIKALVDSQSQTDPPLRTTRLSTRLSAAEVRRQLIAQQGYTDDALPTVQRLTTTLNALGYSPKRWPRVSPKKNPSNRGHLRPSDPEPSGGRRRTGRVTGLTRRSGDRQDGPFCPWREESRACRGGRSRFCSGSDGHSRGPFPPYVGRTVFCTV